MRDFNRKDGKRGKCDVMGIIYTKKDQTPSFCAKMVYLLEQWMFLVLEFHRLDQSIFKTGGSFQKNFNIAKTKKGCNKGSV